MPPGASRTPRGEVALAGLDQGQELEGLVQGAEAAGQQQEGVRLLKEGDLAGEEVVEVDELGVGFDDGVRLNLEGQPDVEAEAAAGAGALLCGLHDAGPSARDHHPAPLDDTGRKLLGVRRSPGLAAETRDEPKILTFRMPR